MNNKLFMLIAPLVFAQWGYAQSILISKSNTASFFSHAPLEDIKAVNDRTTAALDLEKGEIVVKMLIQDFEFENALMQEHFNENYMESEQFPSSVFQGTFSIDQPMDLEQNGTYEAQIDGQITIHGVTKPLSCEAVFRVEHNQIKASTQFLVKPKDFGIKIPRLVIKNIAEEIEVTVQLIFETTKL